MVKGCGNLRVKGPNVSYSPLATVHVTVVKGCGNLRVKGPNVSYSPLATVHVTVVKGCGNLRVKGPNVSYSPLATVHVTVVKGCGNLRVKGPNVIYSPLATVHVVKRRVDLLQGNLKWHILVNFQLPFHVALHKLGNTVSALPPWNANHVTSILNKDAHMLRVVFCDNLKKYLLLSSEIVVFNIKKD